MFSAWIRIWRRACGSVPVRLIGHEASVRRGGMRVTGEGEAERFMADGKLRGVETPRAFCQKQRASFDKAQDVFFDKAQDDLGRLFEYTDCSVWRDGLGSVGAGLAPARAGWTCGTAVPPKQPLAADHAVRRVMLEEAPRVASGCRPRNDGRDACEAQDVLRGFGLEAEASCVLDRLWRLSVRGCRVSGEY
jgi:hypothetical protein